jgi:flagellar motor switch protein FliN/FliY
MDNRQAARTVANAFAEALAALTEAVGIPWGVKMQEAPDLASRPGTPVHFRLTFQGALNGDCFVEFYEPQVLEFGLQLLGSLESAVGIEHVEAMGKVISSAMTRFGAALAPDYGALTFKVDRVEDLAFGGMFVVPLAASSGEQTGKPVLLYFDNKLLTSLSSQLPAKPAAEAGEASAHPANLRLVMDVELNVSLRFGQRQLPLREVLELASGSVIELDRLVDDPVELLLDGKVIARGEAVIVDGNYGLRVTEIPQPISSHFA